MYALRRSFQPRLFFSIIYFFTPVSLFLCPPWPSPCLCLCLPMFDFFDHCHLWLLMHDIISISWMPHRKKKWCNGAWQKRAPRSRAKWSRAPKPSHQLTTISTLLPLFLFYPKWLGTKPWDMVLRQRLGSVVWGPVERFVVNTTQSWGYSQRDLGIEIQNQLWQPCGKKQIIFTRSLNRI